MWRWRILRSFNCVQLAKTRTCLKVPIYERGINAQKQMRATLSSSFFIAETFRIEMWFSLNLQYYCSTLDEKMGYFEVKRGNKK